MMILLLFVVIFCSFLLHETCALTPSSLISSSLSFNIKSPSVLRTAIESSSKGRRSFLQSLLITGITAVPTVASSAPDIINDDCQNGVLVTESAVPGAYQSTCMLESERIIPFKSLSKSPSTVTIHQGSSVGAGRTGVAVWNSCLLLTRLLQQESVTVPFIQNKVVVELGCGTGLASIVCAKLGASRVIATDGNSEVVALAKENVERNNVDSTAIETATLPWGLLDAIEYADVADLIIGSDLTYNSGTWRVLTETISTVLKPGGIFLYLSLGHSGFNVKGELDGFQQVIVGNDGLVLDQSNTAALQQLLLSKSMALSPNEQSVLDATGGVRVLVLRKPS